MSFTECAARSFTFISIQKNAPECSGVYGLSNGREWVFIGEANNIREQLMTHLREVGTVLTSRKPTGFTFEKCSPAERANRQARLVLDFQPFCNHRTRH